MTQPIRGKCLVSASHLRDPNFFKTVVLMIEHGDQGAMGLVVNRPSTIPVSNALVKHFELPDAEDLVYIGGPVEPSALLVLHNAEDLAGGEREIQPNVYIGSSPESFEEVVRRIASRDEYLRYRIFSGCAGWAPGQLEQELANGDWHVVNPTPQLPFDPDPYTVYPKLLQQVYEEHRLLPHTTSNPLLN